MGFLDAPGFKLHSFSRKRRLVNDHCSYPVGVLIFRVAWILCSICERNYRAEIRWGTLIATPMALTSLCSFRNIGRHRCASTSPENRSRHRRFSLGGSSGRHEAPFVLIVVVFIALELWHPHKTMYNTIMAFAAGAVVMAFHRSELVPLRLTSALFSPPYIFFFRSLLFLYPPMRSSLLQHPRSPRNVHPRSPIEELLSAPTGGAIWSAAYEYVQGYRFAPRVTFLAPLTSRSRKPTTGVNRL